MIKKGLSNEGMLEQRPEQNEGESYGVTKAEQCRQMEQKVLRAGS